MATKKEYAYQIRGSQISLLERDYTTSDGLNYTYSGISGDGVTDNIPSGSTIIKSPLTSVVDGIELEFAYSPHASIIDEASEIDLPSYLSKALVYYVKAMVAEEQMNIEIKEYMMREFRRMVEKHESSKISGPRMIIPGPHALR